MEGLPCKASQKRFLQSVLDLFAFRVSWLLSHLNLNTNMPDKKPYIWTISDKVKVLKSHSNE